MYQKLPSPWCAHSCLAVTTIIRWLKWLPKRHLVKIFQQYIVGLLHVSKENEVLVKWIGYEVVVEAWVVRSKAETV